MQDDALHIPQANDVEPDNSHRPILVVDDSRAQRRIVRRMIEGWGHEVLEASGGQEALDLCLSENVDLVITDWMMPGMSGLEFCRAFKEMRGRSPGYVLLLTAKTERAQVAEGLESGADDFLSKPVHAVELRARLRAGQRILDTQRAVTSRNRLLSKALGELRQLYTAIDRDLVEARKLQTALVPELDLRPEGADITLLFQPSGQVGGDLVGTIPVSPTRYGVFSVDVAGHGIASALLVARVAGYLTPSSPEHNIALTQTLDGPDLLPPDAICARLNELLLEDVGSDHYLTMLFADCDFATGLCRLSQAGHPSPMVQRASGRIEFPGAFGMPVGLIEGAEYSEFTVELGAGDRLLLFTDGITECADAGGSLWDETGLTRFAVDNSVTRGRAFSDALMATLEDWQGSPDFADDVSAALIERH